MSTSPLSNDVPAAHGPHVTAWALFLTFSQITLSGFGGMVFWARRVLVERRHWLTEQEFVDLLALGQLLPGPNVLNVTVMVGYRCAGWAGAAAAVTGFLGWPCLLVIALGMLHQRYGTLPLVQPALTGMAAVSAGLLLASVVKMATVLPRHWRPWLLASAAATGVILIAYATDVTGPAAAILQRAAVTLPQATVAAIAARLMWRGPGQARSDG